LIEIARRQGARSGDAGLALEEGFLRWASSLALKYVPIAALRGRAQAAVP